jgi:hypothetical protein
VKLVSPGAVRGPLVVGEAVALISATRRLGRDGDSSVLLAAETTKPSLAGAQSVSASIETHGSVARVIRCDSLRGAPGSEPSCHRVARGPGQRDSWLPCAYAPDRFVLHVRRTGSAINFRTGVVMVARETHSGKFGLSRSGGVCWRGVGRTPGASPSRRPAVAVLLSLALCPVSASEALASGVTINRTPASIGVIARSLSAVSCSSSADCTAIGSETGHPGLLVERWNGIRWSPQAVRGPAVATTTVLSAISCTGPNACTLVGYDENALGERLPLVQRWNGSRWSIQTTPKLPGVTDAVLSMVSCASSGECTAVGSDGSAALVEHWNRGRWSIQPTPGSSSRSATDLMGVSCPSTTSCTAVGHSVSTNGDELTLVEHWNGRRWSIQPSPTPITTTHTNSSGRAAELASVSCTSPAACTAVGDLLVRPSLSAIQALIERWNGKRWSIQRGPRVRGALTGVSCSSRTACLAIGARNADGATLVEHWNGTRWSAVPTAGHVGSRMHAAVTGVSCRAPLACTVVGSVSFPGGYEVTLAERWNGGRLSMQRTPNQLGITYADLAAVSCASSTACTATGTYLTPGGALALLAERWNGRRWSTEFPPARRGPGPVSSLTGVSCPSATECVAVGAFTGNSLMMGGSVTLAERWNGSNWSIQPTPNPAGASSSSLDAVSCSSSATCTAVGTFESATGRELPLIERWNNTRWSLQSSAVPAGAFGTNLFGVSCPSASVCVAVGRYQSAIAGVTLAERWNGSSWSIESTAVAPGPQYGQLMGVSCATTNSCVVVGWDSVGRPPGGEYALAERWNGATWSAQSTSPPYKAVASEFAGVSCPSSTACAAVGWSDGYPETLVESWDGVSWSIPSTANTMEALNGVSCPTADDCVVASPPD